MIQPWIPSIVALGVYCHDPTMTALHSGPPGYCHDLTMTVLHCWWLWSWTYHDCPPLWPSVTIAMIQPWLPSTVVISGYCHDPTMAALHCGPQWLLPWSNHGCPPLWPLVTIIMILQWLPSTVGGYCHDLTMIDLHCWSLLSWSYNDCHPL